MESFFRICVFNKKCQDRIFKSGFRNPFSRCSVSALCSVVVNVKAGESVRVLFQTFIQCGLYEETFVLYVRFLLFKPGNFCLQSFTEHLPHHWVKSKVLKRSLGEDI